jgi:hypothetical protein
MTLECALEAFIELQGLERLRTVISARPPTSSFEWRYALIALDDRIRLIGYCLSREDPALLDAVQARYAALQRLERLPADPSVVDVETSPLPSILSLRPTVH